LFNPGERVNSLATSPIYRELEVIVQEFTVQSGNIVEAKTERREAALPSETNRIGAGVKSNESVVLSFLPLQSLDLILYLPVQSGKG